MRPFWAEVQADPGGSVGVKRCKTRKQKPRRKRRGFFVFQACLADDGRIVTRGDDLLGRLDDRAVGLEVGPRRERGGARRNADDHDQDRRDKRDDNDLDVSTAVGGLERRVVHNHSP